MSTQNATTSTQQVAEKLVELCRKGQMSEVQQEFWAEHVTCISPDMAGGPAVTTKGKNENMEREKKFAEMIEEVYGNTISEPVVAGNVFAISWSMDVKLKGQDRMTMDEVCVYHVKDGKIAQEQYIF
jgi:hypothetical protein